MNVTAKTKWKSVPMDDQLKARGFAEGLLGIEELSSYDLAKIKKSKSNQIKQTGKVVSVEKSKVVNKSKRPLEESNEGDGDEPVKKKKKKTRQKRKPKYDKKKQKQKDTIEPESDENDDEEQPEVSEEVIELEGWKDFNIPKPVLRALNELKFEDPTPIQRETLPAAINGHADILGAAETGSGKTLAFAIPIIHGILNDRLKDEDNDGSEQEEDVEPTEEATGKESSEFFKKTTAI